MSNMSLASRPTANQLAAGPESVMVAALVVMVAAVVLAQELVAILVMVLVIMVVLVLAVVPLVEEIIALHGVGHLVVVQVLGDKDFLELTLHKPDVVV